MLVFNHCCLFYFHMLKCFKLNPLLLTHSGVPSLLSIFHQSLHTSLSLPSNLSPQFSHSLSLILKKGLEKDTSSPLTEFHIHLLNYKLKELSDDQLYEKILDLYLILRFSNSKPDNFTYPFVLKACANLNALNEGQLVHTQIIKSGFIVNIIVANSLIDMYSKVGSLQFARNVFDEMPERNLVSWNCLISGYALNGFHRAALDLCSLVKFEGLNLDKVTLKIVLPVCGLLGAIHIGESIHAHIILLGFSLDTVISTALLDMYAKCGIMVAAEKLFDEIVHKDSVTWNAMISGYTRIGHLDMVIKFFSKMQRNYVEPTIVTMLTSLQACADLPSFQTGETIHGFVLKTGFCSDFSIEALLINMYSKCGRLDLACRAFVTITEENVNSWSAVIHGLGMHGYGKAALMSFFKMLKRGIDPDDICFLLVLSCCSHTGMVSEGHKVFNYMVEQFGIAPRIEHYVTMVDLIGRAGFIEEAFEFIEKMPIEPDISVWGAFFGACKIHGRFEIGKSIEERLAELDPKKGGYYKLLVSSHVNKERWDKVQKIRGMIGGRDVQRVVGYSLLEVKELSSYVHVGTNFLVT